MKKKMNTKKGFTLVEIIVVLVIIAIMAAFAIPAYTGFVDRAKQGELLGEARVFLIAAQTAGQEMNTLRGTLDETVSTAPGDAADLLASVVELAGTSSITAFSVTYSTAGVVTGARVYNGTYYGTFSDGSWTTSKTGAALAGKTVTIDDTP